MVGENEPEDEPQVDGSGLTESPGKDHLFGWFRRLLERGNGTDRRTASRRSYLIGLLGVAVTNLLSSAWLGLILFTFNWLSLGRSGLSSWQIAFLAGIMCVPPAVGFCCAVFVPMFCPKPLALRFAVAIGIVVPSFFVLMLAFSIGEGRLNVDAFGDVSAVVLCFAIGVALVTTAAQLSLRWSLSPIRRDDQIIPKLSVGTLMQLMFVVAVMCVFSRHLLSDRLSDIWLLIFAGLGAASACISLIVTMGVLSGNRRWVWALGGGFGLTVTVLTAWAEYFTLTAMGGSGWLLTLPFALVNGLSLSLLALGIFWVQIYWLRGCGWTVVSR